jgi:hypothetical protein
VKCESILAHVTGFFAELFRKMTRVLYTGPSNHNYLFSLVLFMTTVQDYARYKKSSPATRPGGVWGERRYSSYSFLTSALDWGEWSASRPGRALPRGKDPRYPLYRRLGGPQSRSGHRLDEKSFAPAGDRTPIARSVVRHYTD